VNWKSSFPLWVAALALSAGPLHSAGAQQSPRDAATQFVQAWNGREWRNAAGFLDLDTFDRFRRDFISRARRSPEEGPRMTVDDLRKSNPDMPVEVAEYQIRAMEEQRRRFADPTPWEFARVASASALRSLDAVEAAARWLESRDPQWQVRMQFEQAGCPAPDDVGQIPSPMRRVVGTVTESDSVGYAVVKEEREGDTGPAWAGGDLTVIQLIRVRDRWVVYPRGDLLPEVGAVDVGSCRRTGR